jgi:peptidoglycan-N-acetylmuramic acid deacetylase
MPHRAAPDHTPQTHDRGAGRATFRTALLGVVACAALTLAACAAPQPPVSVEPTRAPATRPATVTPPATSEPTPAPKPAVKPAPTSKASDSSSASNKLLAWNFQRNKKHTKPEIPSDAKQLAKKYSALYVGPDPRVVYLTFDEGYENGNTPKILDTLKDNDVKATFFVTGAYCREDPKLVKRMLAEGHTVGNHSNTHPSMPSITGDAEKFEAQFSKTEKAFKKATGQSLTKIFRPPMGEYSAKSLAMTNALGYTTVFWSFAHGDYDEKNQPPVDTTISRVLTGSHPGAIILLHGMSTSDTKALDDIIAGLKKQGYEFATLSPN